MAAPAGRVQAISKAEYLKRYLDPGTLDDGAARKKRKKKKARPEGKGMRIVDDDAEDWKKEPIKKEEPVEEAEDQPVVAEFVDERPEEIKRMEEFRNTNKWRVIKGDEKSNEQDSRAREEDSAMTKTTGPSSPAASDSTPKKARHDSPDSSSPKRARHDSPDPSPTHRARHDSPDPSPTHRARHDSPDPSPPHRARHDSPDPSPPQRARHDSPDPSPPRRARHDFSDNSLATKRHLTSPKKTRRDSPDASPPRRGKRDSPDASPPRRGKRDSPDASPPRRATRQKDSHFSPRKGPQPKGSDSDLSPPRRVQRKGSDSDLSPPRRRVESEKRSERSQMLSGGRVGLVSATVLREEKEEQRRAEKSNKNLEDDARNTQTVFRDKSGKRRDLNSEREQQLQKQAAQEKKDEMYAKWGKGLAQQEQQRQNMENAALEMSKPLARYIDDEDLDRMLREQERDGDPMAKFLKKKMDKESKGKKERPRYKGSNPPLNRFNIWPGYRWDGVDRSNGFENQYFARISEKKATQESAYKWSVEDM